MAAETTPFITPGALLTHWQAHRRLTRRVIDAFPEDKLFSFSVGGMRPFGELALEMLSMAVPMVEGTVTGNWKTAGDREPRPERRRHRVVEPAAVRPVALAQELEHPTRAGDAVEILPVRLAGEVGLDRTRIESGLVVVNKVGARVNPAQAE